MPRPIPPAPARRSRVTVAALALAALAACCVPAPAQRGDRDRGADRGDRRDDDRRGRRDRGDSGDGEDRGPRPGSQLFDRFDADGDGTLSVREMRNSPLARTGRRMGIDVSKSLSRDEFSKALAPREARGPRRPGDGRRRGGPGRGGEDDRTDQRKVADWVFGKVDSDGDGRLSRREIDAANNNPDHRGKLEKFMKERGLDPRRELSREDWNRGADRFDDRKYDEAEAKADEARRAAAPQRPQRREFTGGNVVRGGGFGRGDAAGPLNPAMPTSFGDFDLDRDGQIGLYEWRRWNRTLTGEFLKLDRDGDGFLTGRELAEADAGQFARGESAPAPLAPVADSRPAVAGPAEPAADAGDDEPAEMSANDIAAAERYFRLLDRDRSGKVEPGEWGRSRKLQPKFEEAGVDLKNALTKEAFVAGYGKTLG